MRSLIFEEQGRYTMDNSERKIRIEKFVSNWAGHGYEKGETHSFWLTFLRDVCEISEPEKIIKFEVPVRLKHTSFIDAFLPDTKVIIEQKSSSENLTQEKSQSDGSALTPYEQAQRYGNSLPYSMRPRWIVVCNFKEFLIYDMELMSEPTKILLEELPEKYHAFDFLIDPNKNKIRLELELSLKAGEIVGKLYDALKKNYLNPNSEESLQSLNKLCVRLVFCLYAESAGIFDKHKIFRDYLQNSRNIRRDLLDLFEVLNTPEEKRAPYLTDELKLFPYVNGGLFAEKNIEIPNFNDETKKILFDEAENFDWSGISPTIFGAVFESTLNPVTRREGGMHYTSIENIHKVINPLFFDDLREEFVKIKSSSRNKNKNLLDFQNKLSKLKFFDPACGSGNFLTETFISLRRLENEILKELLHEKILLGDFLNPVKISINQFFGIEINDFACVVAQTALWIAELQMLNETQEIIHKNLNPLPLKNFANIFEGNALRLDWQNICPNPDFIFGNPPFVGTKYQTPEQKADIFNLCNDLKPLDYVTGWYLKADQFMENNSVRSAFVSTNSITQGEQVAPLWKILKSHIDFAHRTFKWDSESNDKAAVHCVVIGFSFAPNPKPKIIFDGEQKIFAENINGYLQDAPNVYIEKRKSPLNDSTPIILMGSTMVDDGNFNFTPDELKEFLQKESAAEKFICPLIGSEEFINGKQRFCLWLKDVPPNEIKKSPLVLQRVKNVRDFRLKSNRTGTRKGADNPQCFLEIRQPQTNYILIPKVSSERRQYIPIGFLDKNFIAVNTALVIPNAELFHFGVLTSSVHNSWMRAVAGRMKSDYQYSATLVYNNFVWCQPSDKQRQAIEETAQNILDCRKKYPDATLADLYDPTLMPPDLRKAHTENDKAVLSAYGFDKNFSEQEIVSKLMKIYHDFKEKNS